MCGYAYKIVMSYDMVQFVSKFTDKFLVSHMLGQIFAEYWCVHGPCTSTFNVYEDCTSVFNEHDAHEGI